jgi:hypothetical protein
LTITRSCCTRARIVAPANMISISTVANIWSIIHIKGPYMISCTTNVYIRGPCIMRMVRYLCRCQSNTCCSACFSYLVVICISRIVTNNKPSSQIRNCNIIYRSSTVTQNPTIGNICNTSRPHNDSTNRNYRIGVNHSGVKRVRTNDATRYGIGYQCVNIYHFCINHVDICCSRNYFWTPNVT